MFAKESVLTLLQKQRKEYKNRLNNLFSAIEKGLDDEATMVRIKEVKNDIKDLDYLIDILVLYCNSEGQECPLLKNTSCD